MTGENPTERPDDEAQGQGSWWLAAAPADQAAPTVRADGGPPGQRPAEGTQPAWPGQQAEPVAGAAQQPVWPSQPQPAAGTAQQPVWPGQPPQTGNQPQPPFWQPGPQPTGPHAQQPQIAPMWPPAPPPRRSGAGKPIAIVLGCLLVLSLVVGVIVVVASNSHRHRRDSDAAGSSTTTTDDYTTTPYTTVSTTPPFDWNSLDNASTDTTPVTASALLPQTFTDTKGVLYTLSASGEQACVQKADSRNVVQALNQNGCVTNMSGAYIDSAQHILVSVNVLIFPTDTAARAAYDALDGPTQDWGIWCPTTGVGSSTCDGNIGDAVHSQWSSVTHRYFTQATGIYINLTSDSSVKDWVSAGADEAVSKVGPANYWQK